MTIHYNTAPVEIVKVRILSGNNQFVFDLKPCGPCDDGSRMLHNIINIPITLLSATGGTQEIFRSLHHKLQPSDRKESYMQHLPKIQDLKSKPLSELTDIFNGLAPQEQKIKKFRDKPTALKRLSALLTADSSEETLTPPPAKKIKEAKSTKPKQILTLNVRGKRSPFLGKKICVCAESNPRREGTAGHKNWSLYSTGQTFEEYRALGGGTDHLKWDVAKGYIKLQN